MNGELCRLSSPVSDQVYIASCQTGLPIIMSGSSIRSCVSLGTSGREPISRMAFIVGCEREYSGIRHGKGRWHMRSNGKYWLQTRLESGAYMAIQSFEYLSFTIGTCTSGR